MVIPTIHELDTSQFEGLKSEENGICTVEATVPTGTEDICCMEAKEKLGVNGVTSMGRAYFDIAIERVPLVLELRSVENVRVIIHMEKNFGFTDNRIEDFKKLYKLAEKPVWSKGLAAWSSVYGKLEEPFKCDVPLTLEYQEPNPLVDLKLMTTDSPIAKTLPADILNLLIPKKNQSLESKEDGDVVSIENEQEKCSESKENGDLSTKDNGDPVNRALDNENLVKNAVAARFDSVASDISQHLLDKFYSDYLKQSGVTEINGDVIEKPAENIEGDKEFVGRVTEVMKQSIKETLISRMELSTAIDDAMSAAETCKDTEELNKSADKLDKSAEELDKCTEKLDKLTTKTKGKSKDHKNKKSENKRNNNVDTVEPVFEYKNSLIVVPEGSPLRGDLPKFKVTASRSGGCHVLGSPEAARQFGAAVNDRFSWPVSMKTCDLDIILDISEQVVVVALAITRKALYKRNIIEFGPTALRATLAFSLCYLAKLQPGDIVVDHMCGGGGVIIEGSLAYPSCVFLGGDIEPRAVSRARANVTHNVDTLGKTLRVDVAQWDACRLPFRGECVDVFVSDIPFGKRCGSKHGNKHLYARALEETARVAKRGTGRAVLLTYDKTCLLKNMGSVRHLWKLTTQRQVNIGGMRAAIFCLARSDAPFSLPNQK